MKETAYTYISTQRSERQFSINIPHGHIKLFRMQLDSHLNQDSDWERLIQYIDIELIAISTKFKLKPETKTISLSDILPFGSEEKVFRPILVFDSPILFPIFNTEIKEGTASPIKFYNHLRIVLKTMKGFESTNIKVGVVFNPIDTEPLFSFYD